MPITWDGNGIYSENHHINLTMKHSNEKINFQDITVRLKNDTLCYDKNNRTLLIAVPCTVICA